MKKVNINQNIQELSFSSLPFSYVMDHKTERMVCPSISFSWGSDAIYINSCVPTIAGQADQIRTQAILACAYQYLHLKTTFQWDLTLLILAQQIVHRIHFLMTIELVSFPLSIQCNGSFEVFSLALGNLFETCLDCSPVNLYHYEDLTIFSPFWSQKK